MRAVVTCLLRDSFAWEEWSDQGLGTSFAVSTASSKLWTWTEGSQGLVFFQRLEFRSFALLQEMKSSQFSVCNFYTLSTVFSPSSQENVNVKLSLTSYVFTSVIIFWAISKYSLSPHFIYTFLQLLLFFFTLSYSHIPGKCSFI